MWLFATRELCGQLTLDPGARPPALLGTHLHPLPSRLPNARGSA